MLTVTTRRKDKGIVYICRVAKMRNQWDTGRRTRVSTTTDPFDL